MCFMGFWGTLDVVGLFSYLEGEIGRCSGLMDLCSSMIMSFNVVKTSQTVRTLYLILFVL